MQTVNTPVTDPIALESLQRGFEEHIPFIKNLTRKQFRHLGPEVLDDRIAEVLGLSWVAYQREYEECRTPPHELINTIAFFAIRKSRVGRQITGQEATKDALSPSVHGKHGFEFTQGV
jgi:hypothetical protein